MLFSVYAMYGVSTRAGSPAPLWCVVYGVLCMVRVGQGVPIERSVWCMVCGVLCRFIAYVSRHFEGAALGRNGINSLSLSPRSTTNPPTPAGAEFILESRRTQPECVFNPKAEGCFTGGKVVTTFVAVILGALSVGLIGPTLGQLVAAMTSAAEVKPFNISCFTTLGRSM